MTRQALCGPTTFYLNIKGNDANSGLDPEDAWRTVGGAANNLANNFDFQGYQPTVQMAPGTYGPVAGALPQGYVGGGGVSEWASPVFQGDPTNRGLVVIEGGGQPAVLGVNTVMSWKFKDMTIQSAGGIAVQADINSFIYLDGVVLGPSNIQLLTDMDGQIEIVGNGFLSLGEAAWLYQGSAGGRLLVRPSIPMAFIDGAAFSPGGGLFYVFDGAELYCAQPNFDTPSNPVGKKYLVGPGGRINCGGAINSFPGTIMGSCDPQGIII